MKYVIKNDHGHFLQDIYLKNEAKGQFDSVWIANEVHAIKFGSWIQAKKSLEDITRYFPKKDEGFEIVECSYMVTKTVEVIDNISLGSFDVKGDKVLSKIQFTNPVELSKRTGYYILKCKWYTFDELNMVNGFFEKMGMGIVKVTIDGSNVTLVIL